MEETDKNKQSKQSPAELRRSFRDATSTSRTPRMWEGQILRPDPSGRSLHPFANNESSGSSTTPVGSPRHEQTVEEFLHFLNNAPQQIGTTSNRPRVLSTSVVQLNTQKLGTTPTERSTSVSLNQDDKHILKSPGKRSTCETGLFNVDYVRERSASVTDSTDEDHGAVVVKAENYAATMDMGKQKKDPKITILEMKSQTTTPQKGQGLSDITNSKTSASPKDDDAWLLLSDDTPTQGSLKNSVWPSPLVAIASMIVPGPGNAGLLKAEQELQGRIDKERADELIEEEVELSSTDDDKSDIADSPANDDFEFDIRHLRGGAVDDDDDFDCVAECNLRGGAVEGEYNDVYPLFMSEAPCRGLSRYRNHNGDYKRKPATRTYGRAFLIWRAVQEHEFDLQLGNKLPKYARRLKCHHRLRHRRQHFLKRNTMKGPALRDAEPSLNETSILSSGTTAREFSLLNNGSADTEKFPDFVEDPSFGDGQDMIDAYGNELVSCTAFVGDFGQNPAWEFSFDALDFEEHGMDLSEFGLDAGLTSTLDHIQMKAEVDEDVERALSWVFSMSNVQYKRTDERATNQLDMLTEGEVCSFRQFMAGRPSPCGGGIESKEDTEFSKDSNVDIQSRSHSHPSSAHVDGSGCSLSGTTVAASVSSASYSSNDSESASEYADEYHDDNAFAPPAPPSSPCLTVSNLGEGQQALVIRGGGGSGRSLRTSKSRSNRSFRTTDYGWGLRQDDADLILDLGQDWDGVNGKFHSGFYFANAADLKRQVVFESLRWRRKKHLAELAIRHEKTEDDAVGSSSPDEEANELSTTASKTEVLSSFSGAENEQEAIDNSSGTEIETDATSLDESSEYLSDDTIGSKEHRKQASVQAKVRHIATQILAKHGLDYNDLSLKLEKRQLAENLAWQTLYEVNYDDRADKKEELHAITRGGAVDDDTMSFNSVAASIGSAESFRELHPLWLQKLERRKRFGDVKDYDEDLEAFTSANAVDDDTISLDSVAATTGSADCFEEFHPLLSTKLKQRKYGRKALKRAKSKIFEKIWALVDEGKQRAKSKLVVPANTSWTSSKADVVRRIAPDADEWNNHYAEQARSRQEQIAVAVAPATIHEGSEGQGGAEIEAQADQEPEGQTSQHNQAHTSTTDSTTPSSDSDQGANVNGDAESQTDTTPTEMEKQATSENVSGFVAHEDGIVSQLVSVTGSETSGDETGGGLDADEDDEA